MCVSKHRLRRDSEAEELGHRAEERGDRRGEEEHARPAGIPNSSASGALCWRSRASAGLTGGLAAD